MSHVTVFNSSARSFKIPTTPGKYLTEVRDEACKKFNASPDQFTLKYNNKPISLSQQIRLANLPQGARLELVQASRSPTVISVALQLPASEKTTRLTEKFASNTSLWEIIRHFESGQGANYNFTQRGVPSMNSTGTGAGRLNYEMPVITVMPAHKEHSSFAGLQQTLSQLGFDSGSASLRLSFKNSGKPLEEAMAEISQFFKASESAAEGASSAGSHSTEPSQSTSAPDPAKAAPEASGVIARDSVKQEAPEPDAMDVDSAPLVELSALSSPSGGSATAAENVAPSTPASPPPAVTRPVAATPDPTSPPAAASRERNIQIYSAPTSSTPQAARNTFNESDYIPTVEHAKAHQASLSNRTKNTRLLSDKELEAEEAARQEKLTATAEKGANIRIRMSDQTIIEMNIYKADTGEGLYAQIEGMLEHKEPFVLRYISPKGLQVLVPRSSARLIQDLRFTPREILTFVWDDKASVAARVSRQTLSSEWQSKAQKLEVKEPVIEEKGSGGGRLLGDSKSEGKRKASSSGGDKESKIKSLLNKGLFKR